MCNLMPTIVNAIAAIASSIAAIAAVLVISVYRKQVKIGQEQIKISQAQVEISQEQMYDQHRPVLTIHVPDQIHESIIENVGSGVALNIRGIYFQKRSRFAEDRFMFDVSGRPLAAGQQMKTKEGPKPRFNGDSEIGEHPKYTLIPKEPTEASWRITLTYHDIFDRKYASIFDGYEYEAGAENKCIAVLLNIPKDIEDIEREVTLDNRAR